MTAFAHRSLLLPRGQRPYSASGWADGLAGASRGRPQYPGLLSGYQFRPPWNVAGVDYRVGVPEGQVLTDWRTAPAINPGWVSPAGLIYLNAPTILFQNIDFSLGGGAALYNPNSAGYATSITLVNCNFNAPVWGQSGYPLLDQNNANITIMNCTFDALPFLGTGWNAFLATSGSITLLYNWFKNCPDQILQSNIIPVSGRTTTAKYNLYDDMNLTGGAHRNYLQLDSNNVTIGYDVEFNTTYQSRGCDGNGGEGFQIYSNGTGVVLTNPILSNNTMIARLGSGLSRPGRPSMSALVHGNATGGGTTISGTGQNNHNYFDISGATSAFYIGTVTPAQGWSSSGNIDMNTGAAIRPA